MCNLPVVFSHYTQVLQFNSMSVRLVWTVAASSSTTGLGLQTLFGVLTPLVHWCMCRFGTDRCVLVVFTLLVVWTTFIVCVVLRVPFVLQVHYNDNRAVHWLVVCTNFLLVFVFSPSADLPYSFWGHLCVTVVFLKCDFWGTVIMPGILVGWRPSRASLFCSKCVFWV